MQHRSAIVPVLLLLASACGVQTADAKPLKVFILAGQSNMDGQANVSTIDFLGEDKKHSSLLKVFKPDGKTLITREDVWVASGGVYDKLQPGYGGRRDQSQIDYYADRCANIDANQTPVRVTYDILRVILDHPEQTQLGGDG